MPIWLRKWLLIKQKSLKTDILFDEHYVLNYEDELKAIECISMLYKKLHDIGIVAENEILLVLSWYKVNGEM